MAARRLRGRRPTPPPAPVPPPVRWVEAPGHFDGDGCTFPAAGHLVSVAVAR